MQHAMSWFAFAACLPLTVIDSDEAEKENEHEDEVESEDNFKARRAFVWQPLLATLHAGNVACRAALNADSTLYYISSYLPGDLASLDFAMFRYFRLAEKLLQLNLCPTSVIADTAKTLKNVFKIFSKRNN